MAEQHDPRDRKVVRRLRLRRSDGEVYLDRWGLSHVRLGGVLLHRMDAPDPGPDLHDHPWWFVTIPLWGGYTELRAEARDACLYAGLAQAQEEMAGVGPDQTACRRGVEEVRRPFRPRVMRLGECHTIVSLRRRRAWSLVINGPRRRSWGFFAPEGWIHYQRYGSERRSGLVVDEGVRGG